MQSDEVEREVSVLAPTKAALGEEVVWKLRVAVYGLADTSREWYRTSKRMLVECGLTKVTNEPNLFYSINAKGKLDGILAAHVDDFLYRGDVTFLNKMEIFKAEMQVGSTQSDRVVFSGLHISTEDGCITIRTNDSNDSRRLV